MVKIIVVFCALWLLVSLVHNVNSECGVASWKQRQRRIVGGRFSVPGRWPWMAALYNNTEFICGGSIISSRHILTAGHCALGIGSRTIISKDLHVKLGVFNLKNVYKSSHVKKFNLSNRIVHPNYKEEGLLNDIAILSLQEDIEFDDFVKPICIPDKKMHKLNLFGEYAYAAGWGEHGDIEKEVALPIWNHTDCQKAYDQIKHVDYHRICAGMMNGGSDTCQGDSGGPLMLKIDERWFQIGIVSGGAECGAPNSPGLYTRVTSFLPFIHDHIKN